jgi:hypothetical protein
VWILAETGHDARIIYDREYGRQSKYDIKGVKQGFLLVHSLDDTPRKVSLREYVRLVDVYAGGIVSVAD